MERVIIMGAAGRDFHNFNVYFRNNSRYQVVAFTAAQIPDIDGRLYPAELSEDLYPAGIPIYPEKDLAELIRKHNVDLVAFSYSDMPHVEVMHKASLAMAKGADFILIGATYTMLRSCKPVVAVCAVRTGCGKSQTTRKVAEILREAGKRVVIVRHPMPYGDLRAQTVQRFSTYDDFERHHCTIEEREEYEPIVDQGMVVYAGVDYGQILAAAEQEADVIVWDGGNNDTPFYYPDVHIVLVDPHRPGHERLYYPGETNLLMADLAIINKVDTADPANVEALRKTIEEHAPQAEILLAESCPSRVDHPEQIRGKRVLVVEDGPTLTHGGMSFGAGRVAADQYGAGEIVDPRRYAVGTIAEAYRNYPQIGAVLPAMGYSGGPGARPGRNHQRGRTATWYCTPLRFNSADSSPSTNPSYRVRYEYRDHGRPGLKEALFKTARTPEGIREDTVLVLHITNHFGRVGKSEALPTIAVGTMNPCPPYKKVSSERFMLQSFQRSGPHGEIGRNRTSCWWPWEATPLSAKANAVRRRSSSRICAFPSAKSQASRGATASSSRTGTVPRWGTFSCSRECCHGRAAGMPLEILGSQTQGQIGYMIESTLDSELMALGIHTEQYLVSLISYVVVDTNDPAFKNPSKPIGPVLSPEAAAAAPYPVRMTPEGVPESGGVSPARQHRRKARDQAVDRNGLYRDLLRGRRHSRDPRRPGLLGSGRRHRQRPCEFHPGRGSGSQHLSHGDGHRRCGPRFRHTVRAIRPPPERRGCRAISPGRTISPGVHGTEGGSCDRVHTARRLAGRDRIHRKNRRSGRGPGGNGIRPVKNRGHTRSPSMCDGRVGWGERSEPQQTPCHGPTPPGGYGVRIVSPILLPVRILRPVRLALTFP